MFLANDHSALPIRHLSHDPRRLRHGKALDLRRPARLKVSKPSRPTVLVIGDATGGAAGLVEILADAKLDVLQARGDSRALLQAPASRADLVLLDVAMPSASGFEVFRCLRGEDTTPGMPILFVSAAGDTAARLAGFAAGAVDHVSSPFESEEILARVNIHLELRQLRRAAETSGQLQRGAEAQLEELVAQAVLVVDPVGKVVFCTRSARERLARRLPSFDPATTLLPGLAAGEPFAPAPGQPRLHARRVDSHASTAHEHGLTVFLLEEETLDPSRLLADALKLTPTEANVLYWVREGKTSPEIAIIVGAALPTVKKHLEHVYEKLGVETRTAAALVASEVLQNRDAV